MVTRALDCTGMAVMLLLPYLQPPIRCVGPCHVPQGTCRSDSCVCNSLRPRPRRRHSESFRSDGFEHTYALPSMTIETLVSVSYARHLWAMGASSTWPLSPFDMTQAVLDASVVSGVTKLLRLVL